jgi:hypothetical protein
LHPALYLPDDMVLRAGEQRFDLSQQMVGVAGIASALGAARLFVVGHQRSV